MRGRCLADARLARRRVYEGWWAGFPAGGRSRGRQARGGGRVMGSGSRSRARASAWLPGWGFLVGGGLAGGGALVLRSEPFGPRGAPQLAVP